MHDHLARLGDLSKNNVLLCFSHLRWNFVYQRPQHLLSRATDEFEVIFFEEPLFEAGAKPRLDISLTREGVHVAVPVLPHGLNGPEITRAQRKLVDQLMAGARRYVVWYYTPMALPFSRQLTPQVCVYDNMDELSLFRGAPPRMVALERELFKRADVIFTGGQSLYEAKRGRHPNVHAFPSSIDAAHFVRARGARTAEPADYAGIPRPRVGFFGVIDERMDLELVRGLVERRPDWQFVMIGPVVKIDPASLPRAPNLHWLGGRSYADLPSHLGSWDAGFMPFALNESTRFISPTKTPEFLAAGVPVVSTPITDVVRPYGDMGLVEIGRTAEDFAERLQTLMAEPRSGWLREVDAHLGSMSWDLTWSGMSLQMQRAINRPAVEQVAMPMQASANV